jgi:Tol biopolymer transport system component
MGRAGLTFFAALVAFGLVGALLVVLLRDGDADDTPEPTAVAVATASVPANDDGAGATPQSRPALDAPVSSEVLVAIDPAGGNHWTLHVASTVDGVSPPALGETRGYERHVHAAWSPDGSRVAFIGEDRDEGYQALFVMNADGSGQRQIIDSDASLYAVYGPLAWSPDGSRILANAAIIDELLEEDMEEDSGSTDRRLATSYAIDSEVVVIDVESETWQALTLNRTEDGQSVWSPDGTHIAWLSEVEDGMPPRDTVPWVMNADGTDAYPLVDADDGQEPRNADDYGPSDLRWSPDGSRVAITSRWSGFETYIVAADGSDAHPLHDDLFANNARWSWDGARIAFAAYDNGGSAEGIFVANADGSGVEKVSDVAGLFDWSPDGTQLAVVVQELTTSGESTGKASLILVDVESGAPRTILGPVAMSPDPPLWRPAPAAETRVPRPVAVVENGELPEGYLLRTRADVERLVSYGWRADTGTEILDIRLVTQRDKLIEDANGGSWTYGTRVPDDEPVWRVELEGPPEIMMISCRADCPERVRAGTWYQASDGENASWKSSSVEAAGEIAPHPTPPEAFDDLPVDPREPLLPDAEVIHTISTTTTGVIDGDPVTTEIWLDRVNNRSIVRVTRANDEIYWLEVRDGATRVRYSASGYNGLTNESNYARIEQVALSTNSWRVRPATPQLDWYRSALASGHARVVGEATHAGQTVTEVEVGYGDYAHTALLDPETLLPVHVRLVVEHPPDNGVFETIAWETVEGFAATEVDPAVFDAEPPDSERVTARLLNHELSSDALAKFAEYPVWGLDQWRLTMPIEGVRRDAEEGEESAQEDRVTIAYASATGENRLRVTTWGRMRDEQRGIYLADNGMNEELEIDGQPAWLHQRADGSYDLALERDGQLIVVSAATRDELVFIAHDLVPVN